MPPDPVGGKMREVTHDPWHHRPISRTQHLRVPTRASICQPPGLPDSCHRRFCDGSTLTLHRVVEAVGLPKSGASIVARQGSSYRVSRPPAGAAARRPSEPVAKHLDECSGRDLVRHVMLHHVSKAGASANGGGKQVAVIGDERSAGLDPELLSILLELPGQSPDVASRSLMQPWRSRS